ncbi:nucleoside triphosphate pyrophosphohydrolase [Alteromonas aestuariivivens]|uniref:Nucleoside triphosphate pyrophosphohydrolase n=1 Tax=Alteromonas aestuariivivens TaxID=1938339 RepID=A0A3D8MCX8_9ALTE|nr:nucleoside triphosphate pyrophosphohydrolase [Alteromonas aestuariivivens]RDV28089.1 nucleoside triphosphate pyrophosphohydrolase [Alteromonas aestuariivivens]
MSNASLTEGEPLLRLKRIMAQLRDPQTGCPWDLAQTLTSLTRYTIEEAYEVADAIAKGEPHEICDELGDLLFQVVFYARIAEEQEWFDFDDVARAISDKLVRRHPHVFDDVKIEPHRLSEQWEQIKAQERRDQGKAGGSILDVVPDGLPALIFAQKLQKQCAKVGFDWPDPMPVVSKVREEIDEVEQELRKEVINHQATEEEIGDALFAMVNLARHCQVDADTALRKASHKFAGRFREVEMLAKESERSLTEMSLDDMELLWQKVKLKRASAG